MPVATTSPRHCLVTGANRGIGLELVRQLLARGDRVIATCRHPGTATALNPLTGDHPGRLHVLPLEVGDTKSIAELARELTLLDGELPLDLLINNAGVLHAGERFGAVSAGNLDDSFRTNARGPFLLTQALAPHLADACPEQGRRGATVANISSQLGSIARPGDFGTPSYNISKAAQNMATVLLARALADRGITVLALHPGWVQTDMGGAGAEVTPVQSATGLLTVIDAATVVDSGRFLDYTGGTMAW